MSVRRFCLSLICSVPLVAAYAFAENFDCEGPLSNPIEFSHFISYKTEITLRHSADGAVTEFWQGRLNLEGDDRTPPMHILVDGKAEFSPAAGTVELHGYRDYDHRRVRVLAHAEGSSFTHLGALANVEIASPYEYGGTKYMPLALSTARYERRDYQLVLQDFSGLATFELYVLPGLREIFEGKDGGVFRGLQLQRNSEQGSATVGFGGIQTSVQLAYALRGLRAMGLRRDHPIFETLEQSLRGL